MTASSTATTIKNDDNFRSLLESYPDPVIITDGTGKILTANTQTVLLLDYARDELIGRFVETLFQDQVREDYVAQLTACVSGATRGESELIAVRKDGVELAIDVHVSPVCTEYQNLYATVIRDVSERRVLEEKFRRSEERYRVLMESLRDYAVFVLDSAGSVASWNAVAERMTGYRSDEMIGQHMKQLFSAEDLEGGKPQRVLDRAVAEGRYHEEGWRVRNDGTPFFVSVVITPLRAEDGELRGFASVTCDLTRLNDVDKETSHSDRFATVAGVIRGLAHESRNALQQIQSSVEMLTRRMQDHITNSLLTEIQKAHDRLLRLFEDVRAYATPVTLNRRMHNMATIWREAWRQLEPARKNRVARLEEQNCELDLNCIVDQYAMERAFHNILLNSLSACSDPAIIEIRCSEVDLGESNGIRLAISDNGPGLNSEQQEKIFQPFYTTKTKGTGLGMAITKRLIEAQGGQIRVEKHRTNGTEIVITLPRGES